MKVKGIQGIKREQIFFEDIEVGAEIPPLEKPPFWQAQQAAFMASVGSWCPIFFSEYYAKEQGGVSAPLVVGVQMTAILGQFMTDWIGPNGTLRKLANRERNPMYVGNRLITKGKVVKKYVKGGENYLECDIWSETQDGTLINQGSATVTLPSRRQA